MELEALAAGRLDDEQALHGFVYDDTGRHGGPVPLLARQIPAFIMHYRDAPRLVITNALDVCVLEVVGGFVHACSDREYLAQSILPVLAPMQAGEVEPPPFTPHP